ncbi:MAG TPA: polyamine ABC transporter substrate-binding protein [Methylovirgula sp.]
MARKIQILVALLVFAFAGITRPMAAERVVNVYNWSDYIAPDVIEDFTKETGIKVVYDTFDSNATLGTNLLAGRAGYDVVGPSGAFLEREIGAGVYRRLDKSKLPHAGGLSPEVMSRLAVHDPGNRYAVDYTWFTTGLAFNVAKAHERLGDMPLDSWDILFKPQLLKKLADCGVYVLDAPEDLFPIALNYLHLDPNSKRTADLHRAAMLLAAMRPNVKKFDSSEYAGALANGDICLAVAKTGDAIQARNRAHESDNGVTIGYAIPRQGTLMSLDTLAIPKDAPHVAEAYAFIDFLLRPKIAARNTDTTNFANGVPASQPFLAPEIRDDKAIYPDAGTMQRLFAVTPYDRAVQKYVTREWTLVKTGK